MGGHVVDIPATQNVANRAASKKANKSTATSNLLSIGDAETSQDWIGVQREFGSVLDLGLRMWEKGNMPTASICR